MVFEAQEHINVTFKFHSLAGSLSYEFLRAIFSPCFFPNAFDLSNVVE